MTSHHEPGGHSLDDLLGLDPEPRFSPEAQDRLRLRLADARVGEWLDTDTVVTPVGLSERVIRRVRGHGRLVDADRPKRSMPLRLRLVALPLVAAAAALMIWTYRGHRDSSDAGRDGSTPVVAQASANEPVSDELLASLAVLENLEFLNDELDPLEADALFLLSMEDQILLDLLDAEMVDSGPVSDEPVSDKEED